MEVMARNISLIAEGRRPIRLGGVLLAVAVPLALLVLAPLVAGWWAQPVAVFLGRRVPPWDAVDFATLYAAGSLVASGQGHVLYHLDALWGPEHAAVPTILPPDVTLAFLNPPFFSLVFAPLSLLPFDRALQVWLLVNLGLFALNCWAVWRMSAAQHWQTRVLLVIGMASLYPVTFALRLGQFSLFLMSAWTAAALLLRNGHDRAAGVALSGLLIKPELLIPITVYLLVVRRLAVLYTLLPIAAVAVIVSFAVVGPLEGLRYPLFVLGNAGDHTSGTNTELMFGWNGIVGPLIGSERPLLATLGTLPLSILSLIAVGITCRHGLGKGSPAFPQCWLAVTLATVLADPNFFLQDIILIAPSAIFLFAATSGREHARVGLGLIVGWSLFGLGFLPNLILHVNLLSLFLVAALILLVVRSGQSRPRTAALPDGRDGKTGSNPEHLAGPIRA
jgi:hypothetical protein